MKDLLTLTRKEQRGLLVLVILLILMLLLRIGLPTMYRPVDFSQMVTDSLQSYWVRLDEADTVKTEIKGFSAFDPNEVDFDQLLAFGLDSRTASNWIKYLEAGGRFYSPRDIGKLYGMSSAWLSAALPYVNIPKNPADDFEKPEKVLRPVFLDLNRLDSLAIHAMGWSLEMVDSVLFWKKDKWFPQRYEKTRLQAWNMDSLMLIRSSLAKKYLAFNDQEPIEIRINQADTAEWALLRGVGSILSQRIVNYRKALGGFISVEQVAEVYGISPVLFDDIRPFLFLDSAAIETIDVNKASLRRLRNHPYMDFYMARAVVEARREKGFFTNVDELEGLKGFEGQHWEWLKQYLDVQTPQ